MTATSDQYNAAASALRKLADKKIGELGFMIQGMARQALNDGLIREFAHAAVDAALGVKS